MYKFDSGFGTLSSVQPESEVLTIALPEKDLGTGIKELEETRLSTAALSPHECEIDSNKNVTKAISEQQLENLLSNLLKYGVLIASAVVLFGGILYLIRHGAEPAQYHFFHGEPSEFRSPAGVVDAALSGSSRGLIQLGLLLLVATPIVRVIISFLAFLWRREFIYVIVTSLVLASLIYSLIGAYY